MNAAAGLKAVANGSKRFCTSFLKSLVESNPGNLVCSSLSVQMILAMAAYGADGKTATEMRAALHLPKDDNIGLSGYQYLIKILNNDDDIVLRLANRIFTASNVTVKSSFEELTAGEFLSPIQSLDFTDSIATAKAINAWAAVQTENRVKEVVSPGDFESDTLVVLVNAVYFKGQWKDPFEPMGTTDKRFHIDETTTKLVPMMSNFYHFRHSELSAMDARFMELPYEGESLSMIVILPNTITGLDKVLENLDKVNLRQSVQDTKPRLVDVNLPKFKVECNFNLNPTLSKMGMKTMFKTDVADFSGITDDPVNITRAVQTAFIDVNESGTEAFACSRQIGGGAGPIDHSTFVVNRPFYFTILHNGTGISLFNGVVRDPSSK